jgi:Rieske Fe-S protein
MVVASSGVGMKNFTLLFTFMLLTILVGLVMAKNTVGNFIASLTPARNLMAVANIEIDLDDIPEGKSITFEWRGKPLFVRHREQWEIDDGKFFIFRF